MQTNWIANIAFKKGVKIAIETFISFLIALELQKMGVSINIDEQTVTISLTIFITAILEIARNWMKIKLKGGKLGWLSKII